jgi:hypothetical protein
MKKQTVRRHQLPDDHYFLTPHATSRVTHELSSLTRRRRSLGQRQKSEKRIHTYIQNECIYIHTYYVYNKTDDRRKNTRKIIRRHVTVCLLECADCIL